MNNNKSFYDGHDWSLDGLDCARDLREALKTVFIKWAAKGYSPREIAHIASVEASSLECEAIMDLKAGRDVFDLKARRNK